MAWENRKASMGGLYYCRTHRVNGKRRRVYIGTGLVGELAWALDSIAKIERELLRRENIAPRTQPTKKPARGSFRRRRRKFEHGSLLFHVPFDASADGTDACNAARQPHF